MLEQAYDPYVPHSLAQVARSRRAHLFLQLIAPLPKPVRILDIGGTAKFWQPYSDALQSCAITLLNLGIPPIRDSRFTYLDGDGCDLDIEDKTYDVVFSNSTIEHVGSWHNQQRIAAEIQRVGKFHFVQTPNYYFPIEPHFLWPGLHYLPMSMRCWLLDHVGPLRRRRIARGSAAADCKKIRLLTPYEMSKLFPHSSLWREHVGPLSKSIVAHNL